MKNVLLTTSALVCFAGFAYAEVSLSGSAEMGITFDESDPDDVEFNNDIDVEFTLTGATDNGIAFGANIDLDQADGGATIEESNDVFISGTFGTLTLGDTDGAYDRALSNIAGAGLEDEADLGDGTSGLDGAADGEVLRYDYSFADFTFSASLELEEGLTEEVYAFGLAYSGELAGFEIAAGAGFQMTQTDGGILGDGDHTAIGGSVVVGFAGFDLTVVYQNIDRPDDIAVAVTEDLVSDNNVGVSLEYSIGALGAGVGYEFSEISTAVPGELASRNIVQGFVTYDLTGGAELVAAIGYEDVEGGVAGPGTDESNITAGFGLGLAF
ncbi:MAG: porin [Pseudomonadota bacterium]